MFNIVKDQLKQYYKYGVCFLNFWCI